jgi:hypothetical protein
MSRTKLPFELSIAKPCEESWAKMIGSLRKRHCESCERQVHNLAAMTPREIERLVVSTGGKLCGRITRREDGSLVTMEERPRASLVMQIAASSALALGTATATAQAPKREVATEPAVLTGTVLKPDGSGPIAGAMIILSIGDSAKVLARSDQSGAFLVSAPAGQYDIHISENFGALVNISATNLHPGLQSLQPIRLPENTYVVGTVSGEIVARRTFASVMRHPWSYLKYLARRI